MKDDLLNGIAMVSVTGNFAWQFFMVSPFLNFKCS